MIQTIDAPISVITAYNHLTSQFIPVKLKWHSREYTIITIGFHHHYRQGRTLFHVFSVATEEMFFRLELDTETLMWRVTEIADDLPN
ncbi:hypothetical protein A3B57_00960 [Microgenomates group bacterium RIFCSPLOWO2_01_FULL_47_10]|nr:MAG: hypothetical protein A3B57_00960 [Microgenomates group bacterium RIFCSPLOWO2_01_FULL_47_10]